MTNKENSNKSQNDNGYNPVMANTDFMREKIKQRPINKKKLLRRTVITVSLAVVFGLVACVTFLVLEPVINKKLYPEEPAAPVTLPEESASNEMQPEQMYADDSEIESENAANEALSLESSLKSQIDQEIKNYSFTASDYGDMYSSLKMIAHDASKSVVTVTSVTSDTNWFSDSYESSGTTTGLIVASTSTELLILAPYEKVSNAEKINITFCDASMQQAKIKEYDKITGLCVLSLQRQSIPKSTMQAIKVADLGSSNQISVTGLPIIAIGMPVGVSGSVCYGFITSEKTSLDLPDSDYKLLTTDIYNSASASGVICGIKGQVLGIIKSSSDTTSQDRLSAVGITELKSLIEDLSNKHMRPYCGIHGTTVTEDISRLENVPVGVFIKSTDMDSPAMNCGLASGDVITSVDQQEVLDYNSFLNLLNDNYAPGDKITLSIKRQAPEEYIDIELECTLDASTVVPGN